MVAWNPRGNSAAQVSVAHGMCIASLHWMIVTTANPEGAHDRDAHFPFVLTDFCAVHVEGGGGNGEWIRQFRGSLREGLGSG